jgi:hypothetical protein
MYPFITGEAGIGHTFIIIYEIMRTNIKSLLLRVVISLKS